MIVKRYVAETGATIMIDDIAYKSKPPEELKTEAQQLSNVVGMCLIEEARNEPVKE